MPNPLRDMPEKKNIGNNKPEICLFCKKQIEHGLRLKTCGHIFCADCLENYLTQNKFSHCPIDNIKFGLDDIEQVVNSYCPWFVQDPKTKVYHLETKYLSKTDLHFFVPFESQLLLIVAMIEYFLFNPETTENIYFKISPIYINEKTQFLWVSFPRYQLKNAFAIIEYFKFIPKINESVRWIHPSQTQIHFPASPLILKACLQSGDMTKDMTSEEIKKEINSIRDMGYNLHVLKRMSSS